MPDPSTLYSNPIPARAGNLNVYVLNMQYGRRKTTQRVF
jgi:hypothetical protein